MCQRLVYFQISYFSACNTNNLNYVVNNFYHTIRFMRTTSCQHLAMFFFDAFISGVLWKSNNSVKLLSLFIYSVNASM